MEDLHELALFAGAGGGLLGTRLLGFRPVCAVEINPYRREVLLRRQEEGHLEPFPVWDDIRTFDGAAWCGKVDIVTAGFPCQPFSVAGKQQGESDHRNMWPETIRVIREVRPRFALLENVPGLKAKEYFGTILADLASSGYGVRWDCVRASDCGAPHLRDRLWILADASKGGCEINTELNCQQKENSSDRDSCRKYSNRRSCPTWWETEPDVGRVANRMASELDESRSHGEGRFR